MPRPQLLFTTAAIVALVLVPLLPVGCAGPGFTYDKSPGQAPRTGAQIAAAPRSVAVVAPFENPPNNPVAWSRLGNAFADLLVQSLRHDGRVLVRANHDLVPNDRRGNIERLRAAQPPVDYLVLGQVTDFHHTGEVAGGSLRRMGVFGRRNEAIAAISYEIVDVASGETVRHDHVHATARVPSGMSVKSDYSELSPESYIFWSSPLGRAGRDALQSTVREIEQLPSPRGLRLEVVQLVDAREIRVAGGRRAGIASGDRFTLVDHDGLEIPDRATGQPMTAVILRVDRDEATAFVSGLLTPAQMQRGIRLSAEAIPRVAIGGDSDRRP